MFLGSVRQIGQGEAEESAEALADTGSGAINNKLMESSDNSSKYLGVPRKIKIHQTMYLLTSHTNKKIITYVTQFWIQ